MDAAAPDADEPAAATDHRAYLAQRYFPSLDGVRAVAVILVFSGHAIYTDFWGVFYGGNGVNVFFVLSGFLITTLALREEGRRGRLSLQSFYIRRLFRIYPMYFAVLGLYCVLIYVASFVPERRELFGTQLPYYAFGFPEYRFFDFEGDIESGPPFAGAWSIGIEEKFYLVWPLLGFVFLRGAFRARMAVCIAIAALCTLAPSLFHAGKYLFAYVFIVLGVIAALMLHERIWFARLRPLGRRDVVLALFAVFVAFQFLLGAHDDAGAAVRLLNGMAIALALVGIVLSSGVETAWLRSSPMILIGKVSYVFYLTHNFALNIVEETPLGRLGFFYSFGDVLVAFPLAVLFAWIGHVTFERPLVGVGHRLAGRDKPFHGL